MRDESPDRAALIRAGRAAFRPDATDRERVLRSLTGALGPGALVDGSHPAKVTNSVAPAASQVPAWIVGGLGAIAVSAAVAVATHPWTRSPSQAAVSLAPSLPAAEPSTPTPVPPSPSADDRGPLPARPESPPNGPRPVARSSAASTPPDSLPEEVRVLSRAEEQLNSGHADDALRTLAEHERRFPGGALTEERMAARVQALCALGRLGAARADLARFAQAYPRSAQLDRARRACALDAP